MAARKYNRLFEDTSEISFDGITLRITGAASSGDE